VPLVYQKFVDELRASGINVVRHGVPAPRHGHDGQGRRPPGRGREVGNGDTVKFDDELKPVAGGLFDPALTGGHHGNRWAAVKLHEPMPNPVMEEPIRRVLGLTQKKFEGVIAGTEQLDGRSGPAAIADALGKLNVDRELLVARAQVAHGTRGDRDAAVRKLGYLKAAKRLGVSPADWVMRRVPVLPPQFRPVSLIKDSGVPLVNDANYLYHELIEANDNLRDMAADVGPDGTGDERLAVYHAFKAVTGLGDPVTQQSRDKEVRGILKGVFGHSPKFGTVQRKLIGSTVDNVGRAVISPNPDLDMDTIGLPEDRAFDVYSRFVVRRLRRSGMAIADALKHVRDRTPLARKALVAEMDDRPVIANRAPVLHRYGIMAFRPVLTKGETLQVSPLIVKGFNADFDGDAMQYHVPTDEAARAEALERMLPSRQLLSPADFRTPVHVPGQEYVGGLYAATATQSDRPVRTFRNRADAIAAWLAKEIGVGDEVKILGDGEEGGGR
jgi:DNA-directed RNA polymerase subunit beta'